MQAATRTELSNWKPFVKNTLQGFVYLEVAETVRRYTNDDRAD